jgi:hypothetical protein
MPRLEAVYGDEGLITDVEISYPLDLTTQMLEYSAFTRGEDGSREGAPRGARQRDTVAREAEPGRSEAKPR